MVGPVRACVIALLGLLSGSCGSSPSLLVVNLETDLRALVEYDRVGIEVYLGRGGGLDLPARTGRLSDVQMAPAGGRERVAEFSGLAAGTWLVLVRLHRGETEVGTGRVQVALRGAATVVTVRITRDCMGVECPGDGRPTDTACLAGRCTDPGCSPETPELCPPPECDSDSECSPAAEAPDCARGLCLSGACGTWLDDSRCSSRRCLADGCEVTEPDAGPTDSGIVCSPTAEICDGLDNDCDPATPDGEADLQVGEHCDGPDLDACPEGRWSCVGGELRCDDVSGDTTDVACDGVDEDCDGTVDEAASCPCPSTTFEGNRYLFCHEPQAVSWIAARDGCLALGYHLATVDSGIEHAMLRDQSDLVVAGSAWWIGLNDRAAEGAYSWVGDGSAINFSAWDPGEPNDQGGEDCVQMRAGGEWNDARCTTTEFYICESPARAGG